MVLLQAQLLCWWSWGHPLPWPAVKVFVLQLNKVPFSGDCVILVSVPLPCSSGCITGLCLKELFPCSSSLLLSDRVELRPLSQGKKDPSKAGPCSPPASLQPPVFPVPLPAGHTACSKTTPVPVLSPCLPSQLPSSNLQLPRPLFLRGIPGLLPPNSLKMRCQEPQVQRGLQGISAKSCPCLPVFLQFSFLFSLGWRDLPALGLLEQRDGITFVQKVCSQTCFLTGSAIFLLPFPSFSKCCPARGSVCWDSDWQQEGEPWPHLPSSGQAKALIQPSSAKCPGLGAAKGKRLQPRRPGWGLLVLPVGWASVWLPARKTWDN
ncbi:uncharacterized protein LOC127465973 isoform X2 [Manacus candei]|uniref:uncharacterized protein LOC127465973 isoform X2 n=1 Tax=Manacus candei TaxID=415023 RepID=UPI0022269159|nr:uncharacterized protein LOC127465973 isoform X2 [Manacus candei]